MRLAMTRVSVSILVFLFLFSIYAFTMSGRIRFGDEGERYLTAQSLVEQRDWSIRIQPDLHRKIGVDGRNYSSYELGSVLPLVPFYTLGVAVSGLFPSSDSNWVKMLFAGLLNPVITALTAVVLYKFCRALDCSPKISFFVATLYGLATIAWPYSKAFEREPIVGFCLLLAVYAVHSFRRDGKTMWFWIASWSLGFLIFAKIANVILFPLFVAYLALVPRTDKRDPTKTLLSLFFFSMPIALFIGFQGMFNQIRFGSFTDIGLSGTWGSPLSYFRLSNLGIGLGGTLFSHAKSIFLYSPPSLAFLPGWIILSKQRRSEALFVGAIVVTSILFNALNVNWEQPSWWGPKYLVPLFPLVLLSIGLLLTYTRALSRLFWSCLALLVGLAGLGVQLVGILTDDREYLDVIGNGINLLDALDFLRHGALESLVVYLSPDGFPIQVNPYGLLLLLVAALLGLWLIRSLQCGDVGTTSVRAGLALLVLILLVEFVAFLVWIVAPYPQVLVANGNTKFVAGNLFLADGRRCEAQAMYLLALDRGTMYQRQALERLAELLPRVEGVSIGADDLMHEVEMPDDATVTRDDRVTLLGDGALRISVPSGRDAIVIAVASPFSVQPNQAYEISGWMKTEGVYGSGYAVVTVFEDDGSWGGGRISDLKIMDETHGWQPWWGRVTTLPTTRRLFVKVSLWKTFGTVWVEGIRLAQITNSAPLSASPTPCR
jgi:hypothetical protein